MALTVTFAGIDWLMSLDPGLDVEHLGPDRRDRRAPERLRVRDARRDAAGRTGRPLPM